MLFGSRSALGPVPAPAPGTPEPVTPPVPVPAVDAPGVAGMPDVVLRSSIGAVAATAASGSRREKRHECGDGDIAHEASRCNERPLCGRTNGMSHGRGSGPHAGSRTSVAGETRRCLTRPSVDTAAKYTTPPLFVRVDDELAVRRDARALVERPLRQHLHLARREVLRRDLEAAAVAAHEHEALAVGQRTRRDVVAAVERQRARPRRSPRFRR